MLLGSWWLVISCCINPLESYEYELKCCFPIIIALPCLRESNSTPFDKNFRLKRGMYYFVHCRHSPHMYMPPRIHYCKHCISSLYNTLTPHTTCLYAIHHLTPSQVYLGRYKGTGDFYTIKVLRKEAIVKCSKVKHIMARRNNTIHPFLVGLHCSFQTSIDLYFVLDYVNGGALFFHLQREKVFNETRAR